MSKLKKSVFFFLLCLLVSCSQKLDFNQIDNYKSTPSYSISLSYFTVKASNFTAISSSEISETTEFRIFENNLIGDNLVKLDFDYKIKNEFNRDFTMEITLLDNNDVLIYKLKDLKIAAKNLIFKQKEEIDLKVNPNVRNFTKVKVVIRLDNATIPITTSDLGDINFQSSATVHLETTL
ncbi:MAG: hypothetical protein ACWIPJ_07480 [Polaribacter sp.]